jgi:CPA2 family monovalent cation:H+ antiporter-2
MTLNPWHTKKMMRLVLPQATTTSMTESLLLAEIGAVLIFLGVIAYFSKKISISTVPFFLIAGLAFGNGGVADLNLSTSFLNTGAQIGAVLLLLLLGLEYSAKELTDTLRIHWSAGIIDFLANAIPGALIGLLLGWGWVGAIVLSGLTYVSSSGIAAELISESGWNKSEIAKRTISILALEDMALAIYLPIISSVVVGVSLAAGLISISVAFVIIGLVILVSLRREGIISGVLSNQSPISLLLTVFGSALVAAGVANLIGFSGAVAAFLVGLLLTGEVAEAARERLSSLRDFFAALFFLFFGLAIDPATIVPVIPIALLLAFVGLFGKLAVGYVIGKDMQNKDKWKRIGAYLIPRGEFSIVIAALAASTSFGEELKSITITYVIITTLIASLILRFYRSSFELTK